MKLRDNCGTRPVALSPDHVKVAEDGRFRVRFTSDLMVFSMSGRARGKKITGTFRSRLTNGSGQLCLAGPVKFSLHLR